MKYFIIAGEASGDLHASELIKALKARDPKAEFTFLGGDKMAQAAGSGPIIHYKEMAYMGFVEVLKHLRSIKNNFKVARKAIRDTRPDCVILIDYPSFNLKIAKYTKSLDIPVMYYIPPKVWAWKEWRVKSIKKYVDRVLAIFPFEVDFYAAHDTQATYVGNPSVGEIDKAIATLPSRETFINENSLPDKPLIALLPGSRLGEIRENLPIMTAVIKQFPQYRGVIAGAPGVDVEYYKRFTSLPIVYDQTYALVKASRAAIVTSGTATLETALIGTPQVAVYQGGGSKLLYNIMKRVLKISHVTLPNLIAGRTIIPELLMHLCTPDSTAHELGLILPDRAARQSQIDGYADMRERLGCLNAPESAAEIIISCIATDESKR